MSMSKAINIMICLIAAVGAFGCGQQDSEPKIEAKTPSVPEPVVEPPSPSAHIEGQWQSTCVQARQFGVAESARYFVEPARIQLITATSRESNCGFHDVVIVQTSEFKLFEVGSGPESADTIELSAPTILVKPVSAAGVSTLNIRQWCGIKDWSLDAERDVTAEAKRGARNCVHPFNAKQAWTLKEGRLYVGDSNMKPSVLASQAQYFVRQAEPVQ